ncbi:unnamed protein product [Parascedosporium putredinis]|uniref:Uncharacterized protein n=1 Tax=Parascedosporium putredinis TaxID=1442378 RepID=A0A9P1M952_9PEZI|nr:unnamed protein product [Parascedosporium putredinis]CAI7993986.1 unnamed protein product [Parascedosporium putredinis]
MLEPSHLSAQPLGDEVDVDSLDLASLYRELHLSDRIRESIVQENLAAQTRATVEDDAFDTWSHYRRNRQDETDCETPPRPNHAGAWPTEHPESRTHPHAERPVDTVAILQKIDAQRAALRARVNELSRGKLRSLSVIDLPLDILQLIFDLAIGNESDKRARVRLVASCRLTCNIFEQMAAPRLFPILNVALDEQSLHRARQISHRPLLASGVREVVVDMRYVPEDLVTDKKDVLRQVMHRAANMRGFFYKSYQARMVGPYSHALADYRAYRREHRKQRRLVEDKTFTNTLVEALTRMPRARSVRFKDEPDTEDEEDEDVEDNETQSLGTRSLEKRGKSQASVTRLGWKSIERLRRSSGGDEGRTSERPAWDELKRACASLRTVNLDGTLGGNLSNKSTRAHHLPPSDKSMVDEFLGAVLSGPSLSSVTLSMYAFGLTSSPSRGRYELYHADAILSAISSTCIQSLVLSNVSTHPGPLERLLNNLHGKATKLFLDDVWLLQGSWGGVREIIATRFAGRHHRDELWLSLCDLIGGEYGERG